MRNKGNYRLLLIPLFFSALKTFGQEIDSLQIYKDYERTGTTARMRIEHKHLQESQHATFTLNPVDLQKLKSILNKSKARRHFQQKLGGRNYLAIAWSKGKAESIVLVPGFRFINLATKQEWVLAESDSILFEELIKNTSR